jgi:rhomboid protease GluP
MLVDPVAVFRSSARRDCEERAFVLTAVDIDSAIEADDNGFVVWVAARLRAHAVHHLHHYESERLRKNPVVPPLPHYPDAWRGSVLYLVVLLVIGGIVARTAPATDFFAAGVLDPAAVRSGQWWRTITALTLHWDIAHLSGNLLAGAVFGYFAAQLLGNARAWLLIVMGAAAANLIESVLGVRDYLSAGASTAVFTALGLIAAYAWRARRSFVTSVARRWAPLVAGVVLLTLLGTEGEHTNVWSHALGFTAGLALGGANAIPVVERAVHRLPAWLMAGFTLGLLAFSWALALKI